MSDNSASVLLVDDTIENLRLLVGILGERGIEARPVTNAADALMAAEQELPDLILLDVMMPGMNGFELCRVLKTHATLAEVPVIFLTALNDVQDKVAGFQAGGADFISKPFHMEEVLARVSSQIALTRARRDLTESLERLRTLEAFRDDLVHMMLHDVRGLLTVLIASLDFARTAVTGQAAADIDAAVDASRTICRMINTLLDVSRLEDGQMPLTPTRTDVAALAAETVRTFGALDTSRDIRCTAVGPITTLCDADLIRRVVENLVSNAVKHTPSGGAVTVNVQLLNNQVVVGVQDEGEGVPEELRATLFQKFASTRKKTKFHSAGLGLAFCRLAVEAHGGTIGVELAKPVGSIFAFSIPA